MATTKTHDWQALSELTQGRAIVVERVRVADTGVAIEGAFELPRLAQLSAEDQVFVAAFVRSHGSIKEMEKFFGVSYPTIKNRLNRISSQLPFAEIAPEPETGRARTSTGELLAQLERGTLSVDDVLRQLRKPEEKP